MNELNEALELISSNADQADFEGEKPEALIRSAEEALGLRFPPSYRAFLLRLGCGDIAGEEFYGVIGEEFERSSVPNGIWLTLEERKSSELPDPLVIVYATGDGTYYALDTSQKKDDEEDVVVAWVPGASKPGDALEVVAPDFGTFLLETVRRALT